MSKHHHILTMGFEIPGQSAICLHFGTSQSFMDAELDFTQKCRTGADREKIALVKTVELFDVANYIQQNNNERFKKACRKSIFDGLGTVVIFPSIPKGKKDF